MSCFRYTRSDEIKGLVFRSRNLDYWTTKFFEYTGKMKVSEDTLNILVEFDEFDALEKFVTKENFNNKLLEVEENLKERLKDFSENFWRANRA